MRRDRHPLDATMLRVILAASVIISSPIIGSANDGLHSPWTRRVRIALGRSSLDYRPHDSTIRFVPENTIRRPFYRAHDDLPSDTTDSRDEYYERMDSSENEALDYDEIADFPSDLTLALEEVDDDSLLFVSAMRKLADLLHRMNIFTDVYDDDDDEDSSIFWPRLIELANKKLENELSEKSGSGIVCVSYGEEDAKTSDDKIDGGRENLAQVERDEGEEPSHRMSFDDLSRRRSSDTDNSTPSESSLVPAAANQESTEISRFEIRDRFLYERPKYLGEYQKPVEKLKSDDVPRYHGSFSQKEES